MHAKSLIISVVLPHVANIMNKYALIQPYGGVDYLYHITGISRAVFFF